MKLVWKLIFCIIAICVTLIALFVNDYYPEDETALLFLSSDDIQVEKTSYGWFFDGPSEDNVLIFYPGAKVEETAYAPLLHSEQSRIC